MNTFLDHLKRHKGTYILAAVLLAIGFTAWSYSRVPNFDALGLSGDVGGVAGRAQLQVITPNGGEVFRIGEKMSIKWSFNAGRKDLNLGRNFNPVFDLYLKNLTAKAEPITLARNVIGSSYRFDIKKVVVGQWKVVVLNKRLQIGDESDGVFSIANLPSTASAD